MTRRTKKETIEKITRNQQILFNILNFFSTFFRLIIFLNFSCAPVVHPHNNGLYRTQLDCRVGFEDVENH